MRADFLLCLLVWALAATASQTDYDDAPVSCADFQLDLALCVDASLSVTSANWRVTKAFVIQIIQKFTLGDKNVKISVVKFSNNPTSVVEFSDSSNVLETMGKVSKMSYDALGTHTHLALDHLRTHTYSRTNGARQNVHKAVMLLTDGESKSPESTKGSSQKLQALGVQIHVVGVGPAVVLSELAAIASQDNTDFIHLVKSYNDLLTLVDIFSRSVCKQAHITATLPPDTSQPRPCEDKQKLQCDLIGADVCTDYTAWAAENCMRRCNLCKPPPPSINCRDLRSDCNTGTLKGICDKTDTRYLEWASSNCRLTCGYCVALTTIPTLVPPASTSTPTGGPRPCLDLLSTCADYGDLICTADVYKPWATLNCEKYCKFCP